MCINSAEGQCKDLFCSQSLEMKQSKFCCVLVTLTLQVALVYSHAWISMTPFSSVPKNCPIGSVESKWDFSGPMFIGRKNIEGHYKVGKANVDTHKKLYGLYMIKFNPSVFW